MSMNEANDSEWFVLQIIGLDISEYAKNEVLNLVRGYAGRRVYFSKSFLKMPVSVAVARAMLDAGTHVREIRDRLIRARHCNSNGSAYRVINRALNDRMKERMSKNSFSIRG
jgi:hypothetical protein